MRTAKEMNIEEQFEIDRKLTHLVREITNDSTDPKQIQLAIELVYDQQTLSNEEYVKKYFC